jgi:hypothetical protein
MPATSRFKHSEVEDAGDVEVEEVEVVVKVEVEVERWRSRRGRRRRMWGEGSVPLARR